ncbi:MAG TPA: sigma 54-interacting transcriptional regulator [Vicinamibacterales bacterium]|jgi:hypothetical protein
MQTDSEILRRHQLSTGFRLAPLDDWRKLLRTRLNVMVSGPDTALAAFAGAARSELCEPVRIVSCSSPLFFEGRTLLLTDVEMLDEAGQNRLLRWINEPRNVDTQVIALSSDPLFAKVCAQRFNADLYYRLNTILIEVCNK